MFLLMWLTFDYFMLPREPEEIATIKWGYLGGEWNYLPNNGRKIMKEKDKNEW